MGRFVHTYYDHDVVAFNDIGAVSFFSEGKNLDLWGLGNIVVAKSKRNNYWTPSFLDSLCKERKVKIAIVYDTWFSDSLLSRWKKYVPIHPE